MDMNARETILFVDDEESILDIANEYFQHKGYRVVTARNGVEAVNALAREKIDCCFTDINMPEMDGLELAEHIRKTDNTIPVIVMTGFPSLDNTIKTLKNGVVDFLIKPVNLNQMELCVRRVLHQRKLFVENILLKQEVERKERLEKLNRELLGKIEELNILNKILSEFTTTSTSYDVFKRLVEMTTEITQANESAFYVVHESMQRPVEITSARLDGRAARPPLPAAVGGGRVERLIMETASDETPLLASGGDGAAGLPEHMRSYIAVPLKIREKVFGVLTAAKQDGDNGFNEKSLYYLSFMAHNAAYAIENLALYENIYENLLSTLEAFVRAIEAKDSDTKEHSSRVTEIAITIAAAVGCSEEERDILFVAGRLHDIGKIGIRDEVLLKKGRLNRDEFNEIKAHPVIGADIIGQLGLWDREQQIIRHHHERYDGSGYPDGLKGDEIPLLARILSVADVYDAMASNRIYRAKIDEGSILEIIEGGVGTQFDPNIISVFFELYDKGRVQKN